jgi:hypothetical protein
MRKGVVAAFKVDHNVLMEQNRLFRRLINDFYFQLTASPAVA